MKKRIVKRILTVLLLSTSVLPMMAQKNISKLVEELEKRDDVEISMVTNRNPQTREITNKVKTIYVKDESLFDKFVKAFEEDEEYTRTAIKDSKRKNGILVVDYTFKFENEEGNYTYTLSSSSMTKGKFDITIIFTPAKKEKKKN